MILKFLLKHVAGPLVGTIAAKVGEAVGDRIAYEINPPEPDLEPCPICGELGEHGHDADTEDEDERAQD